MYLYPPRADVKIQPAVVDDYDNGEYIAQPKYNGSCCVIFLDGKGTTIVRNREKEAFSKDKIDYTKIDFPGIHRGTGWMVIVGELLNKNKNGEDGKPFNHKVVLFDILVYDGIYLTGSMFEERVKLLELLYPCKSSRVTGNELEMYDHLCCTDIRGVYKSPSYYCDFKALYDDLVQTDMYEGIVLKKRRAPLQFGVNERNNHDWQVKCRKATENYHH